MALTENRNVDRFVDQDLREYEVANAVHIYKGALVSAAAADGYAAPLTAGEAFLGIAYEEADNSSGADGAKKVRCFTQGDFVHALTAAARTNIGDAVYASAEDTLTFTSTANTYVGTMVGLNAANEIILRLDVQAARP